MKKVIIAEGILPAAGKNNTLFGRGGITALTASTAEQALSLHREQRADLLILDHGMPAMGGVKLCAAIRSDVLLREVSIIVLCERTGPSSAESQQAGANAILLKPLDLVELFSKVSHLLMVQDRKSVRVPVRLQVVGRGPSAAFTGWSVDISASGILIESGTALEQGVRLQCSFELQSRPVTIDCVVVRTDRAPSGLNRYGVQFVNLDAKTFILIEHVIKSGGK